MNPLLITTGILMALRRRVNRSGSLSYREDLDIKNYLFNPIDKDWVEIVYVIDGKPYFRKRIPAENVPYLKQDLTRDYSSIPLSGNPYIDAVIQGDALYLGKGMDGIVYRLGDMVVKISSTIPFHPFQHNHRTVQQAMEHTRREAMIFQKLHTSVPCVPAISYIEWGNRGWFIKPYLELIDESKMTQKEFSQLEDCLRKMHEQGYAFGDLLQLGTDKHGDVYFLDLGQAVDRTNKYFDMRIKDDIMALRSLARSNKLQMSGFEMLEDKLIAQSLGLMRSLRRNEPEDKLYDLLFDLRSTFHSLPPHLQDKHEDRVNRLENQVFSKFPD